MTTEPSDGMRDFCPEDPEIQFAQRRDQERDSSQYGRFDKELSDSTNFMEITVHRPSHDPLPESVEVRSPTNQPVLGDLTDTEAPDKDTEAGLPSKLPEESRAERLDAMPLDFSSRSRATTVSVRELEADISPTDTDHGNFCAMIECMAPEVEEILRQCAKNSRHKLSPSTLEVPKEVAHRASPDQTIEFDAVVWSREQYEDDHYQDPMQNYGSMTYGLPESSPDGLLVVGAGVQILEDSIGSAYGVPVTKASVEVARRDSGIKFTLTCVEDGYEDAEVLFDDDFLYEEEMMDPDYFRKKDGCTKPISRPALIRISTY
ncbi:Phosphoglucosamine mutase [Lasiodiplodia theobromae]|uniref:Phosphoglucosamine mutase n=1 Tax=Lasiodiplodia theobromae TaxID=45133 RepID=UPI0015C3ECC4|nr:Phosphoglucosamine mutase [Lasiodiplodia theobromae]KAF4540176.1 Phosphoglucosamine mutase [Lasiodiplodia theobromae]